LGGYSSFNGARFISISEIENRTFENGIENFLGILHQYNKRRPSFYKICPKYGLDFNFVPYL
jgi:hypothetical protein